MDILFIFFILLGIVSGVFLVGIFFPKDKKAINIASLILAIIVSIFTGYICFSSLPSNAFIGKIISCVLILLPLVALGLFFGKIIKYFWLKIIISAILILTFAFALFGTDRITANEANKTSKEIHKFFKI